ncbi:hypothetical protein BcanWSM471_03680 [Bradyrhizobium sp. WSM471]|uniref:hypothetical protein n=1 Tax=Bradyrhizobium sp. WSM471 TaxID=319017 RepID=UPI0002D37DCF|nr:MULTISPECIES: hypothetical protein [Bradyrhizobium]UFW42321.1 hypothetical protein BcanWSM471_03680 [Bradyrhizobium canariense]
MLMLAAWVPIAFLDTSLWFVVLGVIMIDLAVQAVHVTNQSLIIATRPEAASRLIGGYMVFYSIGSALGAIGSTAVYARAGWIGVCFLGAGISSVALLFWVITVSRAPGQLTERCRPGRQQRFTQSLAAPPFAGARVRAMDGGRLVVRSTNETKVREQVSAQTQ